MALPANFTLVGTISCTRSGSCVSSAWSRSCRRSNNGIKCKHHGTQSRTLVSVQYNNDLRSLGTPGPKADCICISNNALQDRHIFREMLNTSARLADDTSDTYNVLYYNYCYSEFILRVHISQRFTIINYTSVVAELYSSLSQRKT